MNCVRLSQFLQPAIDLDEMNFGIRTQVCFVHLRGFFRYRVPIEMIELVVVRSLSSQAVNSLLSADDRFIFLRSVSAMCASLEGNRYGDS